MSNSCQQNYFISIIVPVYNSEKFLKKCLQALEYQTYSEDLYEVIVVDNGSEEDIKSIVSKFGQTKYAYESQPGSYVARNKGISLATGEIIAFTDADCIPASDWLEKGVNKFLQTENCGLVGGNIKLFFKDPEDLTSVEVYESIEYGFDQEKLIEKEHFCQSANLFTSKEIIDRVGQFDSSLKSGGDREWGIRVFEKGYQQVYAEDALVKHPARYSWSQLYKRVTRINGGKHDLHKRQLTFKQYIYAFVKDLYLLSTPPFRSLFKICKDPYLKTSKRKFQFVVAMLFVRYVSAWERIRLKLGGKSLRW